MRIVGLLSGHDGGYCVLEDGKVIEHVEIERYTRIKESGGDSLKYFKEVYLEKNGLTYSDVDHWVAVYADTSVTKYLNEEYNVYDIIPKEKFSYYSHHLSHAAHAFYSSRYDDAYIVSIDGSGYENNEGYAISAGLYFASDTGVEKLGEIPAEHFSLGKIWTRLTKYVFKLSSGYPRGHQAGSVMAMAALGDYKKYYHQVKKIFTTDYHMATMAPAGHRKHVYVPPEEDPVHPYLNQLRLLAESNEKEKFNIAASLQKLTEEFIFYLIEKVILASRDKGLQSKNICLAGGVILNSAAMGKAVRKFGDRLEGFFIPPVPYDGGLNIGACQYHWHSALGNKKTHNFVSPYLGELYENKDIFDALAQKEEEIVVQRDVLLEDCVNLLVDNKIISIFQGRSESGRRALGNRSILANPISENMKSMINEKVKHRQWYRPFAPSVLDEEGHKWFEDYFSSPYMSFVFKFKKEMLGKAPAVEHFDETARVQSVRREHNEKYYDLIKLFFIKTGVPMVLNTSFNDREPICETPVHALNCFLGTEIDYLYFADVDVLVSKKEVT
tara:strand:- start:4316 stop:5980 length:1665 start_codon:yes stop_codon:yes gene_type:complete